MSIPCDKTLLLVPSSKSCSKVKVEYQGHNFQNMAVAGAFVFSNTSCFFREIGFENISGNREIDDKLFFL